MGSSSSDNKTPARRPRKAKSICLPFESDAHYHTCMADYGQCRSYILECYAAHPELFPHALKAGFVFHDFVRSKKQDLLMRRIRLKSNSEVYPLRPSFMMPYMIGRTEAVGKPLFLRRWGVPFEALTYVFGRNPMYWYRAYVSLGRSSLVGTTLKTAPHLPDHLLADEKHSRYQGHRVYIPTTVGHHCILEAEVVDRADEDELKRGYGVFREEAQTSNPTIAPKRSIPMAGMRPARHGKSSFLWLLLFCASGTPYEKSPCAVDAIKRGAINYKTKSGICIRPKRWGNLPNECAAYENGPNPNNGSLPLKKNYWSCVPRPPRLSQPTDRPGRTVRRMPWTG